MDQQEPLKNIPAVNTKNCTRFKPNGVPQISAGEIMRVKSNGKDGRSSNTNSTETTSSSGSHARAVVCINRLTSNNEYLGSPSSSFPPSWGKVRMGVDGVGNSSFAKSLKNDNGKSGLNNKPTGINPAALGQNRVNQNSSLGPCAEAEGWIDKSINGVKRKDDRESDD